MISFLNILETMEGNGQLFIQIPTAFEKKSFLLIFLKCHLPYVGEKIEPWNSYLLQNIGSKLYHKQKLLQQRYN